MIAYKATYTKTVRLEKSGTEITVHLSRGSFARYENGEAVEVDGEWGRSGERCGNDYHNNYLICKRDFFAYIGEKVLDGYVVKDTKTEDASHDAGMSPLGVAREKSRQRYKNSRLPRLPKRPGKFPVMDNAPYTPLFPLKPMSVCPASCDAPEWVIEEMRKREGV